jgi:hypothetical protein
VRNDVIDFVISGPFRAFWTLLAMTKDGPDGGRLSGQGAAASEQLTTTHPTRSDTTAAHGAQKMTATDSGDVTATAATQQPSPMAKRFAAQLEPGVHVTGGNAADRPRRGLAGGALASALDGASCGGALASWGPQLSPPRLAGARA